MYLFMMSNGFLKAEVQPQLQFCAADGLSSLQRFFDAAKAPKDCIEQLSSEINRLFGQNQIENQIVAGRGNVVLPTQPTHCAVDDPNFGLAVVSHILNHGRKLQRAAERFAV